MKKILALVIVAFLACNLMYAQSNFKISKGTKEVPEDASIAQEDILYWVGSGANQIVFAVSWCDPEVALAWGYRFDEDSILVSDIMSNLATVDPRFSYDTNSWGIDDIMFMDTAYDLKRSGDYWMYNINGSGAQLGYNAQYVKDNDFIKWGDAGECAHSDTNWNYSWTTEITPVSNPDGVGIAQYSTASFNVYPNPAHEQVNISVKELSGNTSLYLFDISGKIIYTESFYASENMIKSINVSAFAQGIYFIRLQNDREHLTQKLIIQ